MISLMSLHPMYTGARSQNFPNHANRSTTNWSDLIQCLVQEEPVLTENRSGGTAEAIDL